MFKRRLAVLGAVAVLAITGLAGSAMADETPVTAGGKVTCKTADGKTITLPEIGGKVAMCDGKVKAIKPDDKLKIDRLPDGEALPPGAVKAERLPDGELPGGVQSERVPDGEMQVEGLPDGKLPEGVQAVPARPAEPGNEGPVHMRPPAGAPKDAMKVELICEKTD
ncbi:hypothetical protein [Nonomuraea sp. B19D2]|uniref:hypothetical protein n=1 Tax=Nonomuraea sp. B19D2 TaxID=3159561 RepID=UPI0032DA70D0